MSEPVRVEIDNPGCSGCLFVVGMGVGLFILSMFGMEFSWVTFK